MLLRILAGATTVALLFAYGLFMLRIDWISPSYSLVFSPHEAAARHFIKSSEKRLATNITRQLQSGTFGPATVGSDDATQQQHGTLAGTSDVVEGALVGLSFLQTLAAAASRRSPGSTGVEEPRLALTFTSKAYMPFLVNWLRHAEQINVSSFAIGCNCRASCSAGLPFRALVLLLELLF